MTARCDVVVAGLGAMGAAAAWQLARRGARVIGLDRFAPPHARGSSHGGSRIIRQAYFEDPAYVPLVQRAYALWAELAAETGAERLVTTGGLMIGPPDGVLVRGALASATTHGIAHRVIDAAELRRAWPAFAAGDEVCAVWEPRAGVLDPERAVGDFLARAEAHGATLRFGEPLRAWSADAGGVRVDTDAGAIEADAVVIATGAWMPRLFPGWGLEVQRNVQMWFEPLQHAERFAPERFPIFIWEHARDQHFYGFPALGASTPKVARHGVGERHDPDVPPPAASDAEIASMRGLLAATLPDLAGRCVASAGCLYTNARDDHFVLGPLPAQPRVIVASPCSGHGFKFAPAIGEALARWALGEGPDLDLARFAPPAA